jgi:hypothetical protein
VSDAAQTQPVILIGRPASPITDASEHLLDGFILAMQEFDTETLLAIADDRDEIDPDGWMQKCIRGYVEVWR